MTEIPDPSDGRSYRFGRFELRPARRLLLADGRAQALGARAFDVLVALVERRAEVVSKDELLDRVWRGLVVEEANVQVQVSVLRKVIGADAVATVPRRGYQFVAPADCNAESHRTPPDTAGRVLPLLAAAPWRGDLLNSFDFPRTWRPAPDTLNAGQTPAEQRA